MFESIVQVYANLFDSHFVHHYRDCCKSSLHLQLSKDVPLSSLTDSKTSTKRDVLCPRSNRHSEASHTLSWLLPLHTFPSLSATLKRKDSPVPFSAFQEKQSVIHPPLGMPGTALEAKCLSLLKLPPCFLEFSGEAHMLFLTWKG